MRDDDAEFEEMMMKTISSFQPSSDATEMEVLEQLRAHLFQTLNIPVSLVNAIYEEDGSVTIDNTRVISRDETVISSDYRSFEEGDGPLVGSWVIYSGSPISIRTGEPVTMKSETGKIVSQDNDRVVIGYEKGFVGWVKTTDIRIINMTSANNAIN